jgi:hypothetical protein
VLSQAPLPNALGSNGNLVGWATTEFSNGFMRMVNFIYGSLDDEVPVGWWRQFAMNATGTETDVIRVPFQQLVSNFVLGPASNGYAGGVAGTGKAYFSTLETSSTPTTKYKFYKWFPVSTGQGTAIQGVYETQQETSFRLFRSILKNALKANEIRIFTPPLVTGNSFKIDIIGPDGNPVSGGSYTFTVGTNVAVGQLRCKYNPTITPIYSLGIRITNLGTVNWVCEKIEVDVDGDMNKDQ